MNQPISSLNLPYNEVERLESVGFNYCQDFQKENQDIKYIIEAPVTRSALEIYKEESHSTSNNTKIDPDFDSLIKNEVIPGKIIEFVGLPGAGKTQICYHLALTSSISGKVFLINTNKSFSVSRLREIASIYSSNPETALKNIYCLENITTVVQFNAAINLFEEWLHHHKDITLVIIDSIAWILRQVEATERPTFLYSVFQAIRKLLEVYKFAVIITNDLTTRITPNEILNSSSFGDSFNHAINTRFLLSRNEDTNEITARVLKSVLNAESAANFKLQ